MGKPVELRLLSRLLRVADSSAPEVILIEPKAGVMLCFGKHLVNKCLPRKCTGNEHKGSTSAVNTDFKGFE